MSHGKECKCKEDEECKCDEHEDECECAEHGHKHSHDDSRRKELQDKYYELQFLAQQAEQVKQQIVAMEQHNAELQGLTESLEAAKGMKEEEMMVALGGGVFARAKPVDTAHVLVNVGANVLVEKKVEDAKAMIDEQAAKVKEVLRQLQTEFSSLAMQIQMFQQEFQSMSSLAREN